MLRTGLQGFHTVALPRRPADRPIRRLEARFKRFERAAA